ncbi:hypothetical protein BGZ58_008860, partial [Dissophora ornata]
MIAWFALKSAHSYFSTFNSSLWTLYEFCRYLAESEGSHTAQSALLLWGKELTTIQNNNYTPSSVVSAIPGLLEEMYDNHIEILFTVKDTEAVNNLSLETSK